MKECPKCHARYDDSLDFCTNDGCRLDPIRQPQKAKKHGILKKVIIAAVIIAIVGVALTNHIRNAATYLRIEPCLISSTKAGGWCKIGIDYDGYVWKINHKPDWVSIEESDDSFTIDIAPNTTGNNREGSITIQSGKLLAQAIIQQYGFTTLINPSETTIHFSKKGGNKEITIETDGCSWNIHAPKWIEVTKVSQEHMNISCDRNDNEYRSGYITLTEDNVTSSLHVTQAGKCDKCHGTGKHTCNYCLGAGGYGYGMFYSQCIWCNGAGETKCDACNGSGERG